LKEKKKFETKKNLDLSPGGRSTLSFLQWKV